MLSERNRCPKIIDYMIPFIWHSHKDKNTLKENKSGAARVWRKGTGIQRDSMGEVFCWFFFFGDTFLCPDCGGGYMNLKTC